MAVVTRRARDTEGAAAGTGPVTGITGAAVASAGADLRSEMVAALQRAGAIRTDPVRRAFLAVPRDVFVPEIAEHGGLQAVYQPVTALVASSDAGPALVSSSSDASVMAAMLEALELRPGLRVLEVGTGTGYAAALLKWLVGGAGTVISIETDEDFARRARHALARAGFRSHVVVGDGRAGWPPGAPFHRIMVTAGTDRVARAWQDQLVDGGLMEIPLRLRSGLGAQALLTLRRQGGSLRAVSVVPAHLAPPLPVGEHRWRALER